MNIQHTIKSPLILTMSATPNQVILSSTSPKLHHPRILSNIKTSDPVGYATDPTGKNLDGNFTSKDPNISSSMLKNKVKGSSLGTSIPSDDFLYQNYKHLLPKIIDVHCHFQENIENEGDLERILTQKLPYLKIHSAWIMGTRPSDWKWVNQLCRTWNERRKEKPIRQNLSEEQAAGGEENGSAALVGVELVPCFGCHPWFAHEQYSRPHDSSFNEEGKCVCEKDLSGEKKEEEEGLKGEKLPTEMLMDLLKRPPYNSMTILGEIGLDKVSKDYATGTKHSFDLQTQIFQSQFKYGISKNLPMSIHLVKACDDMLTFLTEYTSKELVAPCQSACSKNDEVIEKNSQKNTNPHDLKKKKKVQDLSQFPVLPNIMLHSFAGSPSTLHRFYALPYFGQRAQPKKSRKSSNFIPTESTRNETIILQSQQRQQQKGNRESHLESLNTQFDKKYQNVFYVSVSHYVNAKTPHAQKWVERIQSIPDDRLLIESDLGILGKFDPSPKKIVPADSLPSCCFGHDESTSLHVDSKCSQLDPVDNKSEMQPIELALLRAAWMVSIAKGWEMEYTVQKTNENAKRFLKRNDQ